MMSFLNNSFNKDIDDLFDFYKFNISNMPAVYQKLLSAYDDKGEDKFKLQTELLPEFYYGNSQDCSAVLLTHNPGESDRDTKGIPSLFWTNIQKPKLPASTGFNKIAVAEDFCKATKDWVNKINNDTHAFLNLDFQSEKRLYIRDAIPFHSRNFGILDFSKCENYMNDLLDHSIYASFNSTIYRKDKFGCGSESKKTLLLARGSCWNGKNGLTYLKWKSEKIGYNGRLYSQQRLDHSVYILVITQIMRGAPLSLYQKIPMNKTWLT